MKSERMTEDETEDKSRVVAGLLELVLPGTMLRFVYSRDEERVLMAIEGADRRRGPSRLREQLKIALEMLRSRGLLFNQRNANGHSGREIAERFVSLRPKARALALGGPAIHGFNAGGSARNPESKLLVPDIPPMWAGRWLNFAPLLLLEHEGLRSAEVEFRAHVPGAEELRMTQAIYNERVEKHQLLFGTDAQLGALERFLGLWLQNERGWTVRCRVSVEANCQVPEALIEMLGGEVFGIPCEIDSSPVSQSEDLSLRDAFPAGWPFPSLLPASDDFSRLNAQKIVNRQLPLLPKKGLVLGTIEGRELRLPFEMRDRHTYIVGATGTGKSTLLLQSIQQDLVAGRGVALLDPHGDLCDAVVDALPRSRVKDTFYLDLADERHVPGINLLELSQGPLRVLERNLVVNELFGIFEQLYDMSHAGGPMFEMYFRNALLLIMESGLPGLTLAEFPMVFAHDKFRRQLVAKCSEPSVVDFWEGIAHRAGGESSLANMAPYIVSKLTQLLHSPVVRAIIGQSASRVDLRKLMDRKGVLLIRLPKGLLGDLDTRLLGMFLVGKIFAAALGRVAVPLNRRHRFHLYVDEFQNFVTPSMARLFAEARKFGLCLTLANQNLAQLHSGAKASTDLFESVLGNVGNLILFRLGVPDALRLAPYAAPQLSAHDLQRLPNFHAFARLLEIGGPIEPLVFATLPSSLLAKRAKSQILKRRKLWGSPRHKIEAEIRTRRERLLAAANRELRD